MRSFRMIGLSTIAGWVSALALAVTIGGAFAIVATIATPLSIPEVDATGNTCSGTASSVPDLVSILKGQTTDSDTAPTSYSRNGSGYVRVTGTTRGWSSKCATYRYSGLAINTGTGASPVLTIYWGLLGNASCNFSGSTYLKSNDSACTTNQTQAAMMLSGIADGTYTPSATFAANKTWALYHVDCTTDYGATGGTWPRTGVTVGNNTSGTPGVNCGPKQIDAADTTASFIVDSVAPIATVSINGGAIYTAATSVYLATGASDAGSGVATTAASNDGVTFTTVSGTNPAWVLSPGDGPKTVYYRVTDNAGNATTTSASITLDTTIPGASLSINGGATYTRSTTVTINISSADATSGVAATAASNDGVTFTAVSGSSPAWTLSSGDGTKPVYYRVTDKAGNTNTVTASIILDTVAPTASLTINNGATYTTTKGVDLTTSYADEGSGVASTALSNDDVAFTDVSGTNPAWVLPSGDGPKTIWYRVSDRAGNATTASATIILDSTPPAATLSINSGGVYTNATSVTLATGASDSGSGVASTSASNDGTSFTPVSGTSVAWTLPSGDGSKTVYYRVTDAAGNARTVSTSITLDTTKPTASLTINGGALYTNSTGVTLAASVADTGSGVASTAASNDGTNFTLVPGTSVAWTLLSGDGAKTVWYQVTDGAGNVTTVSASITLDTRPPATSVLINGGAAYATSTQSSLNVSAQGGGSTITDLSASNDGVTFSSLVESGGTYSGGGAWHTVALAGLTAPAGAPVSGNYDAWVSSNCWGQSKVFTWRVVDSSGATVSSGSRNDTIADSGSGHDMEIAQPFGSVLGRANDWFVLQIEVSSSCAWNQSPTPVLAISVTSAGTLPGVETSPLGGGGIEHVVAVNPTTTPAGTVYSGHVDAWVSSSCYGQHKIFTWRAINSYGITLAAGSAEASSDATDGHQLELSGSFYASNAAANDWYALRISVSSGCTWYESPSATLSVSTAVAAAIPAIETGSQSGSSVHHVVAASTSAIPAGAPVAVTYDLWASTYCFGQSKWIAYQIVNAVGAVLASGGSAANDNSTGHDVHFSGVIATSNVIANDWYAVQMWSVSTCTWSQSPAPLLTLSSASPAVAFSWSLLGGDGVKTVTVRAIDAAGNSSSASTSTTLDATPPSAAITINGGAAYTPTSAVTLNLSASDATSGVATTSVSNDDTNFTAVSGTASPWTLTGGEGQKFVWYRVTDRAGNVTTVSASIVVDQSPPILGITSSAPNTNQGLITAGVTVPATSTVVALSSNFTPLAGTTVTWNVSWTPTAAGISTGVWCDNGAVNLYTFPATSGQQITKTITSQPSSCFIYGWSNGSVVTTLAPNAGTYAITTSSPTIWFNPASAGSITLSSSGSDAQSGVASTTFGPLSVSSGWSYTPATLSVNPASVSLFYAVGAPSTTLQVSATNAAGMVSNPTTITLAPDSIAPVASFTTPSTSVALSPSGTTTSYTVAWTDSDSGSGVGSRSLQQQRSLVPSLAACASATYTADGAATGAASPVSTTLIGGYCYRWVQTLTDQVGNTGTTTSPFVFVAPVTPPSPSSLAVAPGSDTGAAKIVTRSAVLRPSRDLATSGAVTVVPAGSMFSAINEIYPDKSGYVRGQDGAWNWGVVGFPNNVLASTDSVNSITINTATANGAPSNAAYIVLRDPASGSLYDVNQIGQNSAYLQSVTLTTRPWDGHWWTVADIDALEAGFTNPPSFNGFVLYQLSITVNYQTFSPDGYPTSVHTVPIPTQSIAANSNYGTPVSGSFSMALDTTASATLTTTNAAPVGAHVYLVCGGIAQNDYDDSRAPTGTAQTFTVSFGPYATAFSGCTLNYTSYGGPTPSLSGSYTYDDGIVLPDPTAGSQDRLTATAMPTIIGSVDPSATRVDLFVDGASVGSDVSPLGGRFSVGLTSPLVDGPHSITAVASNAAGTSSASDPLLVTIATAAPAAASAPTLSAVSDDGARNNDGITDVRRPAFTGTAPSNAALVELYANGVEVGTDNAPANGTYSVTAFPLDPGTYTMTTDAVDAAGNRSVISNGTSITIVQYLTALRINAGPTSTIGANTYFSIVTDDEINQPVDVYTGTATITTDDPGAVFPDGTTVGLSAATHTSGAQLRVEFSSQGTHTVTVSAPNAISATTSVSVSPTSLILVAPQTVYAGNAFPIKLSVRDPNHGPASSYGARVTFTSSDPTASYGPEAPGGVYTFACGCEGGHEFAVTLSTIGIETITVTDQFGETGSASINVVAATGTWVNPVMRIDAVQWGRGNTVDYYITASAPFRVLAVHDMCSVATSEGDGGNMINLSFTKVDPTTHLVYGQFSSKLKTSPICYFGAYEVGRHEVYLTDAAGSGGSTTGTAGTKAGLIPITGDHSFVMSANRWYHFSDVPSNGHFSMIDPGDPIVSMSVPLRGGTPALLTGPTGDVYAGVPNGLTLSITTSEPLRVYGIDIIDTGNGGHAPAGPQQIKWLNGGSANTFTVDDIPYHMCSGGQAVYDNNAGRIDYDNLQGRRGSLYSTGLYPSSTADRIAYCTLTGTPWAQEWGTNGEDPKSPLSLDFGLFSAIRGFFQGDPVDPFTGGLTQQITDFSLGGQAPALGLTRTYRGDVAEDIANTRAVGFTATLFGPGWSSSLDWGVATAAADGSSVSIRGDDGGLITFVRDSSGVYHSYGQPQWTLTALTGGGYNLIRLDASGYTFDGSGRLTTVTSATGHTEALVYDGAGKLITFTDATGRTANVTTNAAGQITRVDLPDGRHVTYTYDATGHLASDQALDGSILAYVTDRRGRLLQITENGTPLLTNTYDGSGRVIAQSVRGSSPTYFVYDPTNHITRFIGPRADITTDCFDETGHLISRLDALGGRRTWTYDSNGNPQSATDELGNITSYVYDTKGEPTKVTDPLGRSTSVSYDSSGRPSTISDDAGNSITTTVDPVTNLPTSVTRTSPPAATTLAVGNLTNTTGNGPTTWTSFGSAFRAKAGTTASWTTTISNATTYSEIEARLACGTSGIATGVYLYDNPSVHSTPPLTNGMTYAASDTVPGSGLVWCQAQYLGYGPSGVTFNAFTISYDNGNGNATAKSAVVATYTYDDQKQLKTTSAFGGPPSALVYDAHGYVTTMTDPAGRTTTFMIDPRGYVGSTVDPAGNAAGGVPADHTTRATYDDMGRVLTATDALGKTTSYTYDSFGRPLTATSPLGFVATNTYDDAGRLTSITSQITDTLTATTSYEYDAAGNRTAVVDPEGRRTEFSYDLLNRLISVKDSDGHIATTAYDAASRVISATDATGKTATTGYDDVARASSVTDSSGKTTSYAYNDLDQIMSVTAPLNQTTSYGYDWLGRQSSVTNALSQTTSSTYNDAGDLVTVTDPQGHTTTFGYNLDHQTTSVLDALQHTTSFEYDASGRMSRRTDANGHATLYAYDAAGRPTSVTDPLGHIWTTAYDADGRIDHTVDADGQRTSFAYDRAGRILSIAPASGAAISFAYDKSGRLLTMTDSSGTTSYGYSNVGLTTNVTHNGVSVGYAYDAAGRLTGVTYPGSIGSVNYAYDTAGRLASISDWANRTTSYTYDGANRIATLTRPGGLVTSFGYDALNRPTSVTNTRAGTPILELGYAYDADGNLKTVTDDQGTTTFGYDALYRLTSALYPGNQSYAYTYDPAGNLTEQTTPAGTIDHAYNAADRLTDAGYTYDDNGALLSDPSGRSYAYDGLGRLTGVASTGISASYTLDGAGRRTSQTINGTTTDFVLDTLNPNATVLSDGTRTYLPGGASVGYEQAGVWQNALTNFQGSILGAVSETGVASALTRYDPFGNIVTGSADPGPFGFAGEYRDATGLINLRARAYDPTLGRFTSRDSFGGVASAPLTGNHYIYGADNPIGNVDPSGHFVKKILIPGVQIAGQIAMYSDPVTAFAYTVAQVAIGADPITGAQVSPLGATANLAMVLPFFGMGGDVLGDGLREIEIAGPDIAGLGPEADLSVLSQTVGRDWEAMLGHSERVSEAMSAAANDYFGLGSTETEYLGRLGLLHDVGKSGSIAETMRPLERYVDFGPQVELAGTAIRDTRHMTVEEQAAFRTAQAAHEQAGADILAAAGYGQEFTGPIANHAARTINEDSATNLLQIMDALESKARVYSRGGPATPGAGLSGWQSAAQKFTAFGDNPYQQAMWGTEGSGGLYDWIMKGGLNGVPWAPAPY